MKQTLRPISPPLSSDPDARRDLPSGVRGATLSVALAASLAVHGLVFAALAAARQAKAPPLTNAVAFHVLAAPPRAPEPPASEPAPAPKPKPKKKKPIAPARPARRKAPARPPRRKAPARPPAPAHPVPDEELGEPDAPPAPAQDAPAAQPLASEALGPGGLAVRAGGPPGRGRAARSGRDAVNRAGGGRPLDLNAVARRWMKRVSAAINQRAARDYPRSALRARLTGRVMVKVQIDERGRVLRAWLARSSGVGRLDAAAVRAAEQLGQVPAPPAALHRYLRPVAIPVSYELGSS